MGIMKHQMKTIQCESCPARGDGIFCALELAALREIDSHKVTNTYKKGQIIFHQGNPPFGIFCVNKGKIKLTKTGNDGKISIVRLASDGDVLGHRSLFSNESYSATATALEDTVVCFIDKDFLMKTIKDHPSIALDIIQKLSREMGSAEQKSASMFQKNVRERLAELFLTLKDSYGIEEEKGRTRLDIKLTREEIACMVGTATETAIRFITEFRDEGLIDQSGKTIYIINEEKLRRFANVA